MAAAAAVSTAALRLALAPGADGRLEIRILKRRGGRIDRPLHIDVRAAAAGHDDDRSCAEA
jgi:hypothetical protein